MSLDKYKEQIKQGFLQSFNKGDYSTFEDLFAPDAVSLDRAKPVGIKGPEGAKQLVENFRKAFPDIQVVIESQTAESDKVITQWSMTGTHKGDFLGKTPTNKQVKLTACSVDRLQNGKIIEYTTYRDDLGFMQQIDAN
ncbi:hypothetical protein AMR41_01835 [Hapalosiphon sp. MRB220]|nr:hypothetical protein AMR41_01835 [Hapalosiphon sp. MRB220]